MRRTRHGLARQAAERKRIEIAEQLERVLWAVVWVLRETVHHDTVECLRHVQP